MVIPVPVNALSLSKLCLAASVLALAACAPSSGDKAAEQADAAPMVAPVLLTPEARDAHSYAQPAIARVTHVSLDLTTDFRQRRMSGKAVLDVAAAPGAKEIVLDSKTNKVWGVLLQDGSYVKADAVVCNADAPWAYNNLLPATPYAKKVDQLEYTASTISFYWYHSPSSSPPS